MALHLSARLACPLLAVVLTACNPYGGGSQPPAGPTAGTGSPPAAASPAPGAAHITIKNFAFTALTVAPGTKVTVVNTDSAPHTVTATDHSFDTGRIPAHGQGSFTAPAKPGSYPYICTIHPSMKATLVVR